nr:reverse transcriptase domain-containing protein [Tanacetum cinerariifolium]
MVTKLRNEITNFCQRPDESLFEAWEHYKLSIDRCPNHNMLPVTQIDTFYNGLTLIHRDTFMKRHPEECYDLIENMTAHHNDCDTSTQRSESSSSITSSFDPKIIALKAKMAKINKNLMKVLQTNHQVKAVTPSCETCGGPHSYNDCPATVGQTQNVYAAGAYQGGNSYQPQGASHGPNPPPAYQAPAYQASGYQALVHQPPIPQPQVMNTTSSLSLETLPSNTITNPKEDLKGITTRSGNAYQGPMIPTTSSSSPQVVEHQTGVIKDTVPPTNNQSTKDVQPPVVQIETPVPNSEPIVAPVVEPVAAPVTNYNDMTANRIDVIDMACEEYLQEVLGFSDVITSGNPTPYYDPIVSTSFPTLTPFGDSDFLLEEVDAFLALKDDPTSREVDHSYYDPKGGFFFLKHFLMMIHHYPLPIKEYKDKVDVIAKLPHPTTIKGIHSFLGHAGYYRRFIQDFSKIARSMTHLLEKDTPFFFSKECVEAFQTLKRKLTEAPILVTLDWDLPFELMCDESDFAIGSVLGQQKTKHFQPIHYVSKTITNAQAYYTTTEKELLVVVYAFEKFWPYLFLCKSIVYTDHSALKYLFNKQDAKPRLLRWVLLLQEFDITVCDKKGAKNLVADHLSRLENPHQSVLDKKEINEMFPLETLNMVSFCGDSSTPCITFGTTPSCSKSVRIKSSGGVFTAKKPLTISRLAIMDPPGDIMAQTIPSKRERFRNEMKCLKIPSKFVKFFTFEASISWGRSRLYEGTTFKTPIGCTSYKLVYRKACHLPIELEHKAYWALKHANFDLQTTGDHQKVQLNELNELRDQAYENSQIYKEKTKRIHDSKIKDRLFNVGDRVLLFNSRLKNFSGKLKTRWSGPFTITHVFS